MWCVRCSGRGEGIVIVEVVEVRVKVCGGEGAEGRGGRVSVFICCGMLPFTPHSHASPPRSCNCYPFPSLKQQ